MTTIKVDDLSDGKVVTLLVEHREEMHSYSPPDSIHALDMSELSHDSITFWSAWQDNELAGCGALKEIANTHGEIKAMRTVESFLRQGIAAKILDRILEEAKSRSYRRVSLETGANEAFLPAIRLYQGFGFVECEAFGNYKEDPYSLFFTKTI